MGRFQITLAGLFGCIAVIGVVLALWNNVDHARKSARVTSLAGNFKQAVLSLHHANDDQGRIPEAECYTIDRRGRVDPTIAATSMPLYSWRLAVTPYGGNQLPVDFGKPWNHPANAAYFSASNRFNWRELSPSEASLTRIFAITGPGTAFGEPGTDTPHSMQELAEDTVLLVEVANSGVHWMEPGDFDIRTMPRTINDPRTVDIEGTRGFGFYVAFADGQIWRLGHDTPFAELEKFFTIRGAKENDREQTLRKYRLN